MMTDLETIEYAVQVVILKCRRDNPGLLHNGASGETVMKWFAEALRQGKEINNHNNAALNSWKKPE